MGLAGEATEQAGLPVGRRQAQVPVRDLPSRARGGQSPRRNTWQDVGVGRGEARGMRDVLSDVLGQLDTHRWGCMVISLKAGLCVARL